MPELNNAKFAFDNAIKLLNDNNLKESVEQLNEIIKIEPNHIKSLNLLGMKKNQITSYKIFLNLIKLIQSYIKVLDMLRLVVSNLLRKHIKKY